jgi:hypothetical protein
MPDELLDSFEGEGKVFEGTTFVADVRFRIRIYQNYEESVDLAGNRSRVPTLKRSELEIVKSSRAIPMSRNRYTLQISKTGGRQDFYIYSPTTALATGGIV